MGEMKGEAVRMISEKVKKSKELRFSPEIQHVSRGRIRVLKGEGLHQRAG